LAEVLLGYSTGFAEHIPRAACSGQRNKVADAVC